MFHVSRMLQEASMNKCLCAPSCVQGERLSSSDNKETCLLLFFFIMLFSVSPATNKCHQTRVRREREMYISSDTIVFPCACQVSFHTYIGPVCHRMANSLYGCLSLACDHVRSNLNSVSSQQDSGRCVFSFQMTQLFTCAYSAICCSEQSARDSTRTL